ncbi:MAG: hypothetical protein AB7S70_12295 [Hyphomicrobium sp.]|uniref:hypothetical protein n=1 Tax=Hyphomicrobium sp. TaxID=82 RepID=UPI003D0B757C
MHQIVPKASAVADPLDHLVPGAAAAVPAAPSALFCPHTGAPCAALASLFSSLSPSGEEACGWLRALAPCSHCRVAFEAGRDRLRHLRLGQRERDILLAAASGAPLVVTERGMLRSASAARRRAALSLGKAGLVRSLAADAGTGGGTARSTVALTELGHYVMAAYGRYLAGGKPIRWTRPARAAELPGRDPSLLREEALARTQAALRDILMDLKGVLLAVIGRPVKDPGRLEAVTRHLEHKAAVLKAVLAPTRAGGA